jgi:hypothetical protein
MRFIRKLIGTPIALLGVTIMAIGLFIACGVEGGNHIITRMRGNLEK